MRQSFNSIFAVFFMCVGLLKIFAKLEASLFELTIRDVSVLLLFVQLFETFVLSTILVSPL